MIYLYFRRNMCLIYGLIDESMSGACIVTSRRNYIIAVLRQISFSWFQSFSVEKCWMNKICFIIVIKGVTHFSNINKVT